ncbi:MAG TPA: hypothetical protein VK444_04035 [Methanobacteriaceae archaeon]|nr:hypothetical protein [Methanobacteriaceae archaeon]
MKLEKEFHKLYNETRLMLIKELESENDLEMIDALHYAQLILNRYMFVCFAEDTGLIPPQTSTETISSPILTGNILKSTIWQRINKLFTDISNGNKLEKINAYNGELFEENLEFLRIRDLVDDQSFFNDTYQKWKLEAYEQDISHLLGTAGNRINPIYRNMLIISSFDFSSELDVNILGHNSENSMEDIEDLKEDIKRRHQKERQFIILTILLIILMMLVFLFK